MQLKGLCGQTIEALVCCDYNLSTSATVTDSLLLHDLTVYQSTCSLNYFYFYFHKLCAQQTTIAASSRQEGMRLKPRIAAVYIQNQTGVYLEHFYREQVVADY